MKYNFNPKIQYDAIDTGSLIAGTSQLASTAIGAMATSSINKRAENYNWAMFDAQNRQNIAMSDRANNYNTPANQMQRFKDAGLNPNLVYGQGNPGNEQVVSSAPGLAYNPKVPDWSGIGTGLQAGLSVQLQQSQLKNQEAQNIVLQETAKKISADTDKVKAETPGATAESGISAYNLQYKQDMKDVMQATDRTSLLKTLNDIHISQDANERANEIQPSTLKTMAVNIKTQELQQAKTAQETENLKAQIKLLQNDNTIDQFEMFLNKNGLTKSDPEWQRAAALMADKYKNSTAPGGLPQSFPKMDTTSDPVMQYFHQKNFKDMKEADISPYLPNNLKKR